MVSRPGVIGVSAHGTERSYQQGCHCDACRAKHAETRRLERARRKAREADAAGLLRAVDNSAGAASVMVVRGRIAVQAQALAEEVLAARSDAVTRLRVELLLKAARHADESDIRGFKAQSDTIRGLIEELGQRDEDTPHGLEAFAGGMGVR